MARMYRFAGVAALVGAVFFAPVAGTDSAAAPAAASSGTEPAPAQA